MAGGQEAERGQLVASAAQVYDAFFVPALFAQFAGPMAVASGAAPGARALDVACGTGVVAQALAAQVGPRGHVTGVDINLGMLDVARGKSDDIQWRQADAARLPFATGTFDAVTCQFGLMFFPDPARAVAEMLRVLKPGGNLAVNVWAPLETTPGYAAMVALLEELFGQEAADALRAPFALGRPGALEAILHEGGAVEADILPVPGTARFPSVERWVETDIKGWTLADRIDDEQYQRLQVAAASRLAGFAGPDGSVAFAAPAIMGLVHK